MLPKQVHNLQILVAEIFLTALLGNPASRKNHIRCAQAFSLASGAHALQTFPNVYSVAEPWMAQEKGCLGFEVLGAGFGVV